MTCGSKHTGKGGMPGPITTGSNPRLKAAVSAGAKSIVGKLKNRKKNNMNKMYSSYTA